MVTFFLKVTVPAVSAWVMPLSVASVSLKLVAPVELMMSAAPVPSPIAVPAPTAALKLVVPPPASSVRSYAPFTALSKVMLAPAGTALALVVSTLRLAPRLTGPLRETMPPAVVTLLFNVIAPWVVPVPSVVFADRVPLPSVSCPSWIVGVKAPVPPVPAPVPASLVLNVRLPVPEVVIDTPARLIPAGFAEPLSSPVLFRVLNVTLVLFEKVSPPVNGVAPRVMLFCAWRSMVEPTPIVSRAPSVIVVSAAPFVAKATVLPPIAVSVESSSGTAFVEPPSMIRSRGSSRRCPPFPARAARSTLPRKTRVSLPDTSTAPPSPPELPPREKIDPTNRVLRSAHTTTLPPSPLPTASALIVTSLPT